MAGATKYDFVIIGHRGCGSLWGAGGRGIVKKAARVLAMVSSGDFKLEVRVEGSALNAHDVEGRSVVQAKPGAPFEVDVECSSLDGLYLVECLIDGKSTSGRYQIDPARITSRGGVRHVTFKHWVKSRDGHQVKHAFAFSSRLSTDADDDDRPAQVQGWEHGKVQAPARKRASRTPLVCTRASFSSPR
jgi:hypothetical protein